MTYDDEKPIHYQCRLWTCSCGDVNDGERCDKCGKPEEVKGKEMKADHSP
jgi:hypothetical protein